MPEIRRYKVIETREVQVTVATDGNYEQEAVKRAQAVFLNPTPGLHSFGHSPVIVRLTKIERV